MVFDKTIVVGWTRHLPLYDIFAASDDCIAASGNPGRLSICCPVRDISNNPASIDGSICGTDSGKACMILILF
ncbi:hypothetical protein F9K94_04000 [Brucella tritici]|uniref:Uncharacterized protein n=1 Tax=Brucella tritici TaxID=94626 RepID=A0A7V7VY25_9HYPH|nr:hypothetical protein F9K94_04000 [Brucella tritici]